MKKLYITVGCLVIVAAAGLVVFHRKANHAPAVGISYKGSYIALGDSVAAGVGLRDDSDSSACDRTNQGYPYLVAHEINYKLTNLSCSGASLPAGLQGQQDVNQLLLTPQLQRLFTQPKPDVITLTIGANDAHWSTVLAACYTGDCGSAADTAAVTASLATMGSNLHTALAQIQDQYRPAPPKVIITGYHQVFPVAAPADCTDLTGISPSELAWGRQLQSSINDTIKKAANGLKSVTFVPVDFGGHELCSGDSWVQGLSDKQPYHPTADGQAAFAKAIATTLKATQ